MIPALIGAGLAAGTAIGSAFQNDSIARRNYQNQLDMQRYNEALQQQIFAREDTAYQRTVKDMRKAGLSPLTMNGTNGAGEALAMDTPQRESSDFSTVVNSLFSVADMMNELKSRQLQNQNLELQNKYLSDSMQDRLKQSSYSAESTRLANVMSQYLNADKSRQNEFNKYFNINDGMTEKERAAAFALKALGKDYTAVTSFSDELTPLFDKSVGRAKEFLGTANKVSDKIDEVVDQVGDKVGDFLKSASEKTSDFFANRKITPSSVFKDIGSGLKNFVLGSSGSKSKTKTSKKRSKKSKK